MLVWLFRAAANNHRLSKPHQGPLDELLGWQFMKHNPTVALYVFNGIEGNSELRKTRRGSSRTTLTLLFLDWCSYPSRPFDPYSAPLGWAAKSLLEVFLNIAQTLAFVAYRTDMGTSSGFCEYSQSLSTPFWHSLIKDMFHMNSLWETMFGDRVFAQNTKSSREGVTLLPCAGYQWRHS